MGNDRVDEFLDLYKKLEQLLKANYGNNSAYYESVIVRYENSRDIGIRKNALGAIRDIRNLLQHNPKINGQYIIQPSDEIMSELREIVHQVEHPRLAIDFGVRSKQIFKGTLNSGMMQIIDVMKQRGFSHVPIFDNGKLYGVLSAYSVFEFVTEQGMQILTEETKVSAAKSYLPIENHKNEYYMFLPKTATFYDADEAFERRDKKGRRLVVIFITETGSPDEYVLAMLTPWSVVGK